MNNRDLNFVFFGTPDVASETLEILKQSGFLPTLIITAPDRPAGRKMLLTPPPVKTWAIANNIPYIQPEKPNEKQIYDTLRALGSKGGDGQRKSSVEDFRGEKSILDLFLVIAYGKILPENLIKMPRLGSINIHYSLLPKYRGASPLESALLNGDKTTGIAIQQMEYKMDSGPILAQVEVPINSTDTIIEMRNKLITLGAEKLVEILPKIFNAEITPVPQDESLATFCTKIKKEDGLVDLEKDSLESMYNKYRAYKIWPRIYFFKNNKRIIITDAVLEEGKFIIKKIIPEGGKEQGYRD